MNDFCHLSSSHAETIVELGRRGPGGAFSETVLSELFELGLIEVRCRDRRVVLTQMGDRVFQELVTHQRAS